MKLETYLNDRKITPVDFAKRIGVDSSTVTRWISGVRRPEWPKMELIIRETNGAVMPNDFLGVDWDYYVHQEAVAAE